MVQGENTGAVYTLTAPPNPALTPPPGVSNCASFATLELRILETIALL